MAWSCAPQVQGLLAADKETLNSQHMGPSQSLRIQNNPTSGQIKFDKQLSESRLPIWNPYLALL